MGSNSWLSADISPRLCVPALLLANRLRLIGVYGALLPGVGVAIAFGAVVVKLGIVGLCPYMRLNIGSVFAGMSLNVCLGNGR